MKVKSLSGMGDLRQLIQKPEAVHTLGAKTFCQGSGRPSMRIIFKSAPLGKMEFVDFRAGKYKASPDCGTE